MSAERIYQLIARKLSGEATQAELQELNDYLQQQAGDQYLYDILDKYWSHHSHPIKEEAHDEEERFRRLMHNAEEAVDISQQTATIPIPARTLRLKKPFYYAAAAVLLVAGTLAFFYYNHTQTASAVAGSNAQVSEVSANPGSRSKLILPDGTQVWLNVKSRLTYLNSFNGSQREVNLEGEAFFDVTSDASRPFVVHTSGIAIKVLGTAFTVKSYPGEKTIEATLLRGSIEVVKNDDPAAPKVILRPHEKLVFNKEAQSLATQTTSGDVLPSREPATKQSGISVTTLPKNKPDSALKEMSWVYNKLDFEGDRFDELALKMERWYDVRITFRNESLRQYRFKGVFENETIREALEALQFTAPFEYRIDGNEIEIFRK